MYCILFCFQLKASRPIIDCHDVNRTVLNYIATREAFGDDLELLISQMRQVLHPVMSLKELRLDHMFLITELSQLELKGNHVFFHFSD